jgi:glutaredoxin
VNVESPVLRLLGREDCHLCEVAQRDLDRLGVAYQLVDIDRDGDDLLERYNDVIPVVLYGDHELARAPIDAKAMRRALDRLKLVGTKR